MTSTCSTFPRGGASNDYICRTLLTQLSSFRPDLVLVYFTHQDRKEFVDDQQIYLLGPWNLEADVPDEPSINFYAYYSDEVGFINTVRSILLLQYFLQSRRIPYVFAWAEGHRLGEPQFMENPACKSYADQIDRTYLTDLILPRDDFARDNSHPGPRSNAAFGGQLFDFYERTAP